MCLRPRIQKVPYELAGCQHLFGHLVLLNSAKKKRLKIKSLCSQLLPNQQTPQGQIQHNTYFSLCVSHMNNKTKQEFSALGLP